MDIDEPVTVTSALPYIHGTPHLGNIVGSILPADIYHRYLDLRGVRNEFVCGSDVHGTPLELEALEQGKDVEELAEENHQKVKQVLQEFEMDFSIYSQTHSDLNRRQTYDMFEELYCGGHIEEEEQEMAYCQEDERFLPDRYIEGECPHCGGLARGDQCDDCGKLVEPEQVVEPECQICGSESINFRKTTHLKLNLSDFQEELLDWIEGTGPVPGNVEEDVVNAIEDAESRTITRDIDWGFEVPVKRVNQRIETEELEVSKLDPEVYSEKVLYVWFDAPIGYIGFTRELFEESGDWREYWSEEATQTYSIGKDNTIFHTVIWPSMLIGASTDEFEYGLPDHEFIQQFLLAEDTQFSKSRGKGLSTEAALEAFEAGYWRFYLAKNLPENQDTKFSLEGFESEVNSVLNDTVGNFVNRTLKMIEKYGNGNIPETPLRRIDEEKLEDAEQLVSEYRNEFEKKSLRGGLEAAVELARIGDAYLSDQEPWKNQEARGPTLQVCSRLVRGLAVLMYPYTPKAAERISEQLNFELHTEEGYDEFTEPLAGGIMSGHEIGNPEPIFQKIDVSETDLVDNSSTGDVGDSSERVSFEEFNSLDLRVGEIEEVEEHPNADLLYVIQLDVGDETLQTCAGLRENYSREELRGRQVAVVANMEEAELRGETSECMILAAEDEEGNVSLIQPGNEIETGSKVR